MIDAEHARAGVKVTPWPAADQEQVPACPACGETERSLLHDALWDNSFFTAPGLWTMWQCARCSSGFLDPRPTPESIGRAYENYYTHEALYVAPGPVTALQRLRAALANGYRNGEYRTRFEPANPLGHAIGKLLPPLAKASDVQYRYLRRKGDGTPRVLDVGCGAGRFLLDAQAGGWEAHGVDFDEKAVASAQGRGLDVRLGGIELWADHAGHFDAVTMSHVIEHVHQPRDTLQLALRLLKPGGRLYVETPNLDALGHGIYGRHWRGLEPPRHLTLFTKPSLKGLLERTGFERVRSKPGHFDLAGVSRLSAKIAAGLDPYGPGTAAGPSRLQRLRAALSRRRTEFMVLIADKPGT